MARLPSFFSRLCLPKKPKFLQCTTFRIQNLSFDQFSGDSGELRNHHQSPDESLAKNQIFGLGETSKTSEDLAPIIQCGAEELARNENICVTEVAKAVSEFIGSQHGWEGRLLSSFPAVNFADPTLYTEVLKEANVSLSLRFYYWLRSINGSSLDQVFSNVMFGRLVEANNLHDAKVFLDDTKFEPEPRHLELYVRCLCKEGLIDEMLHIVEWLRMVGYCCTLETWNLTLSCSVAAGRVDVVWRLYNDMIESGVSADVNTIGSLIQAFCLEKNVGKAYELLREVMEAGHVPDNIVFNKLIAAFCRNGNYGKVSAVLHHMIARNCSPDIYTYQEVIHGLCKGGKTDEGLRIFNELKDRGYSPDTVMYTTMIDALCKNNNVGGAQKLWIEMIQKGITPNVFTYCAFLDGLWKNGHIPEAEKLHEEMLSKGYAKTTVAYNTMINGLCLNGKAEEARVVFERMKQEVITRDRMTYIPLIKCFTEQGKTTDALYFLKESLDQGIQPSTTLLTQLITKLCETERVEEAETLWQDLRDRGLEPPYSSLEPIVCELTKQGHFVEVMEWLGLMINHGYRPYKTLFEVLFESLSLADRFDCAFFISSYMLKMGFLLNGSVSQALLEKLHHTFQVQPLLEQISATRRCSQNSQLLNGHDEKVTKRCNFLQTFFV